MSTDLIAPRPAPPAGTIRASNTALESLRGCPDLAKALAAARDRCKAAAKDGRNAHHNYAYATADEVIATASAALAGSELGLIPTHQELLVLGSGTLAFYALNRTVLLAHSSGEFVALEVRGWPVLPERGRPLDKAFSIALTTSLSYLLRDLLQMPRGTQDDAAAQDDRHTSVSTAPPPANGQVQSGEAALAEARGGGPEGNVPPPASPPPATITPEQRASLVAIYQAKKRVPEDVGRMLASAGLKALDHLPRSLLQWALTILTDGQVGTEQLDRISTLIESKKLPWDGVSQKLQARYGVNRLALLSLPQASEVEALLSASPKPAPAPAA